MNFSLCDGGMVVLDLNSSILPVTIIVKPYEWCRNCSSKSGNGPKTAGSSYEPLWIFEGSHLFVNSNVRM